MKKALVLGAGGFIGSHMVTALKNDGYWVRGVDLKYPDFSKTTADEFIIGDLRDQTVCADVLDQPFDEVWQFAADMGGAGYVFTGEHDADIMHNSAQINLTIVKLAAEQKIGRIFYSSSACMYPEHNQLDPANPNCEESSAYPANPDSEYGWEKLFSERLYLAFARNYDLNVRVGRFHNIYGIDGTWDGGKEKAPAAMCRKVALASDGDVIEVWGPGTQTRSFLFIDACIEACRRMMAADFEGPVNIGSEEMIAINDLAKLAISISGKNLTTKNIDGPVGVNGRNSDNKLFSDKIGWNPSEHSKYLLSVGMKETYSWINMQVESSQKADVSRSA